MTTRIAFTESSALTPTTVFAASGALAVGDVVYQVAGADKTVAKADADGALVPPIGVVHSVVGSNVIVALNGEVAAGLTGLTRGTTYWLGTTAGSLVSSKPASNAYIVGVAVSASELLINTVAADLVIGSSTGTVTSFDVSSSDLTITNDPITSSGVIDLALNTVPVSKGGTGLTSAEQGASLIASSSSAYVAQASSLSWRNRVINGDMRVNQRNFSAALITAGDTYFVDRWYFPIPSVFFNKFTAGKNLDAITPPSGFSDYIGVKTTTAASASVSDYAQLRTNIEGSSVYDFGWGSASARSITLSFWFRANTQGTYSGSILNGLANRSYVFTFSVSQANTWERKTITLNGDTSGLWYTNNQTGIILIFNCGTGSNQSTATTNSWISGTYLAATGSINIAYAQNAAIYLTGVQLEVGSVATPFEVLPYEKQLELCQRYFARLSSLSGSSVGFGAGCYPANTTAWVYLKYPQQMRATPTMTPSSVGTFDVAFRATTWGASYYGSDSMTVTGTRTSVTSSAGRGCVMAGNTSTSYVDLNAEL